MLLFSFAFLLISPPLFSQVAATGIGTLDPHASAALDVVNTTAGLLIPRMDVNQKNAIVSPASGLLIYDTTNKCISQNTGSPTTPSWVCLSSKDTQNSFFYMPSIAVDASELSTNSSINLYEEYKKQFSTPAATSEQAPNSIPYFPKATDLYYYVVQVDRSVLESVSLSTNGIFTYGIIKQSTYLTFIDVVLVIK